MVQRFKYPMIVSLTCGALILERAPLSRPPHLLIWRRPQPTLIITAMPLSRLRIACTCGLLSAVGFSKSSVRKFVEQINTQMVNKLALCLKTRFHLYLRFIYVLVVLCAVSGLLLLLLPLLLLHHLPLPLTFLLSSFTVTWARVLSGMKGRLDWSVLATRRPILPSACASTCQ